jgi:hypothetical protein
MKVFGLWFNMVANVGFFQKSIRLVFLKLHNNSCRNRLLSITDQKGKPF